MQNLTSFEKHNKKHNSFDLSFDFSHYYLHFCRKSAKTAFKFSILCSFVEMRIDDGQIHF